MLRKFLFPALALAALAGCATDYGYRNGNGGDYYYGQPRVEYRYHDPYGYGSYGYGGGYYYDRYGRLVYGNPYGYYGLPYGYGSWWYRPRPRHHDGNDNDNDGDPGDGQDGEHHDRKPPWRDIGGMLPRPPRATDEGEDTRPRARRQATAPLGMPSPLPREPRMIAPREPRMRSDDGGGSRMGRVIRGAKSAPAATGE